MSDHFDAFVETLQEQIFDETKEAFGEALHSYLIKDNISGEN